MYPRSSVSDDHVVANPAQATVTRWSTDPFSLGAYSELQHPLASDRDREVYAKTEGNVLFTGEGAEPLLTGAQCTHGALLGGVSAALEVFVGLQAGVRSRLSQSA